MDGAVSDQHTTNTTRPPQPVSPLQQAANAIKPQSGDPVRNLEPVHADEPEIHEARWTVRLVIFLRVMAVLSMAKGLYHWAVVSGVTGPPDGFEYQPTPWQTATVFFAVIVMLSVHVSCPLSGASSNCSLVSVFRNTPSPTCLQNV